MRSAATCHSRERRQDARIVSRTRPGSMGSAVRNRSLARASRLSSLTSGRPRAPRDMPVPSLQLSRGRPGPWLAPGRWRSGLGRRARGGAVWVCVRARRGAGRGRQAYRVTAPAVPGRRRGHRWRRAVVIEPGQCQEVRGLEVVSGEDVHRVTGSASAAARPGTWPGGLQRAPAASAGCAALRAP